MNSEIPSSTHTDGSIFKNLALITQHYIGLNISLKKYCSSALDVFLFGILYLATISAVL